MPDRMNPTVTNVHERPGMTPRDPHTPANADLFPAGGHIAAEAQATVPDLHYWRFDPDPDDCEHGATVTRHLDVVQPTPGDPGHAKVIGRTVDPVTLCLVCHHLTGWDVGRRA